MFKSFRTGSGNVHNEAGYVVEVGVVSDQAGAELKCGRGNHFFLDAL